MSRDLAWQAFEDYVNTLLGLSPTAASGSQFHDKGDGVDRRHHSQTDYAVQADAKYTTKGSYAISLKLMRQWAREATSAGKSFIMPIRFVDVYQDAEDFVVVPLQDYAMLLEAYRRAE